MNFRQPVRRAVALVAFAVFAGASTTAAAQSGSSTKAVAPALVGGWAGTVTVQLGDSTINAPVMYNFVESGGATSGTAMVPGQGTGTISNVVRSGNSVKFRVTAKQGEPGKEVLRLLEHDGTLASDGALSGMVMLDGKPVAKFRITPRK